VRFLLKLKVISIVFLITSSCSTGPKSFESNFNEHPLAIVQGTTDNEQTFISILSHKKLGDLKYFIEDTSLEDGKKVQVFSYFKKISPDGQRVLEKIHVKGLRGMSTYQLIVKGKGEIIDQRSFKPLSTKRRNIRIGVVSCMDDRIGAAGDMWKSYLNKFLDVNFFIGDNVYADRLDDGTKKDADEAQLWLRYTQTWDRLYFYHSSQLSPTYYLWDDHDYGKNDGGFDFKNKEIAKKVFWSFHPNENLEGVYHKTFGAGSILDAFGQKFIFIDARFFRKNQKGEHWGKEQKDKILAEISKSNADINWLIQGDQFFGGYHQFESFEKDNPKEFKNVMKSLKSLNKPIVFISGDRHLTEIMTIEKQVLGYETYEITSSGIHAKVFPGAFKRHPNPRSLVGKSGVYNYSVIGLDRELTGKEKKFKLVSYGAKDWKHYTKELSIEPGR
jgi:alkaline phosphatase D